VRGLGPSPGRQRQRQPIAPDHTRRRAEAPLPAKSLGNAEAPRKALGGGKHAPDSQTACQTKREGCGLGPGLFLYMKKVGAKIGEQPT